MAPLTHHDILRLARPLVEHGWRVELAACSREHRRIAFRPVEPAAAAPFTTMLLEAIDDSTVELSRVALWPCPGHAGADGVSSLCARVALQDLAPLVRVMSDLPDAQRCTLGTQALLVLDEVLLPDEPVGRGRSGKARRSVRSLRLRCPPLVLDIDASTSAGSPADLRLWHQDAPPSAPQAELASGAVHPDNSAAARVVRQLHGSALTTAARAATASARPDAAEARALLRRLPDDLLAVLSPHWRVLRWQGGYWKGALARPRRAGGTALAEAGQAALDGLQDLTAAPQDWHTRHRTDRRRVFVRRLKPLMALGAILAVMPIAWLATSRGNMQLHPLLLGITPLLMVAMIALTSREIPVMEWPPSPAPLPDELVRALLRTP